MKKKLLVIFIGVIFFISCVKEVKKEAANVVINPNPQTMQELVVPNGFLFNSINKINFTIKLLANNNQPLKNIKVDILDESFENGGNIIASSITDMNGVISLPIQVATALKQVILNTDFVGIANNIIVPLTFNQPEVNITIGGKKPMKVLTTDNLIQSRKNNALGKSFSRLSFKLGSFNAGINKGEPNYLVNPDDVVSSQFLYDINAILPEFFSVPANKPQILSPGIQKDLLLNAADDVWITFFHEGALIRNSLFYFAYNKNNKPTDASQIDSLIAVFPNVSFDGSGGFLATGNKVKVGHFGADTAIGFALAQDGWNGIDVDKNTTFIYSIKELNPETNPSLKEHVVFMHDIASSRFVLGFEDSGRESNFCDHDFNDCMFYLTVNNVSNVNVSNVITTTTLTYNDADGDGILDPFDEYPNDATKAYNVSYPSASKFASIAFEDLWPSKGDYDLNDLVVDYQYNGVLNANNLMVEMVAKYKLRAAGGVFKNGFSVELPLNKSAISNITGGLGLETGVNKAILKVFANSTSIIKNYNTIAGQTPQVTDTITMNINFVTPQNLFLNTFNPFLYVNEPGKGRGHEIHLAGFPPTELANLNTLGTFEDNSNAAIFRYYMTKQNLPFAISLPESFAYPAEKNAIISAYLKFGIWAQSGGSQYQDWYKGYSGYRTSNKIF